MNKGYQWRSDLIAEIDRLKEERARLIASLHAIIADGANGVFGDGPTCEDCRRKVKIAKSTIAQEGTDNDPSRGLGHFTDVEQALRQAVERAYTQTGYVAPGTVRQTRFTAETEPAP